MPRPPETESEFRPFKRWAPWVVPSFVAVNMYSVSCFAGFLGRFSFQPLKENPLLGPSSTALEKMGALEVSKVVEQHQAWRLITSIWLHAGVVHILANMLSLVFIGIRLEQEFGFVKIGLLYLISGFGANILSSLFLQSTISVGASGALFGLLGAMLSELLTNWTIYANKLAALLTLILVIILNLAVGVLPHVDNFAHIGGFITGFLLGFILLIRPQFGWVSQKHARPGLSARSNKPKHKPYQYVLWIGAALLLISGMTVGLVMLFRGVSGNDHCTWCHYLSCVPISKRSCRSSEQVLCEVIHLTYDLNSFDSTQDKLNVTCLSNGRTHMYPLIDDSSSRVQQLCTQLCN
ncbi:RHOMBOID-like protein 1 [Bienertia sinuspersici]